MRAGPLALGGVWLACTENFADLSWGRSRPSASIEARQDPLQGGR